MVIDYLYYQVCVGDESYIYLRFKCELQNREKVNRSTIKMIDEAMYNTMQADYDKKTVYLKNSSSL